jgi:type IV secretion system protein VirD4
MKVFVYFRGTQLMFAADPAGPGKGVGVVIPNLLHCRDSVVVLDIKGQSFKMTDGFRSTRGEDR